MADKRLDNIRVIEGDGRSGNLNCEAAFMFGVLADGFPEKYLQSVLERAEELQEKKKRGHKIGQRAG
jgi:hypothetical protein